MIKKPLLNYKTQENIKKLVCEENSVAYFNHCKDIRYIDKRPIGMITVEHPNLHRVLVNGNEGMIVQRISHYDYVVNGNLVTQCVGCSFEYLEELVRNNVQHGDYEKQYLIKEEIIKKQNINSY